MRGASEMSLMPALQDSSTPAVASRIKIVREILMQGFDEGMKEDLEVIQK